VRQADALSSGVPWMDVCCECFMLSGRGHCNGLIHCPEEFYGFRSVMSVVFCQVEVSATG